MKMPWSGNDNYATPALTANQKSDRQTAHLSRSSEKRELKGSMTIEESKLLAPGTIFRHVNGKLYVVHSCPGCFFKYGKPVSDRFGGQSLRDGKAFGPMRDMKVENVAEIICDDKYCEVHNPPE